MTEQNIYSPPNADLEQTVIDKNLIKIHYFDDTSTVMMVVLNLIVGWFYPVYWLISRCNVLNEYFEYKIPEFVTSCFIFTYVAFFLSSLSISFFEESLFQSGALEFFMSAMVIALFSFFALGKVIVFMLRSRLLKILNTADHYILNINPIWAFIFGSIFLQYKLNQAMDIIEIP
jgi:hypothetical protein